MPKLIPIHFAQYGRLVSRRKGLLAAAFVASLLTTVMESLGLFMLYPLFTSVVDSSKEMSGIWKFLRTIALQISDSSAIEGFLYLFLFIFLMKAIFRVGYTALKSYLVAKFREDLSLEVLNHYLHAPYSRAMLERRGKIIHNITVLPRKLANNINLIITLLTSCIFCATLVGTLLLLQWQTTLALIGLIILGGVALKYSMFNFLKRKSKKMLVANQAITSIATESINSLGVVRLLGIENQFIDQLKKKLLKFMKANISVDVGAEAPFHFGEFVILLLLASLFLFNNYVLGVPFQETAPLVGTFAIISFRLYGSVNSIMKRWFRLLTVVPWIELAHQLLTAYPDLKEKHAGTKLNSIKSDIEFRNISVKHTRGKSIFDNFSLTIPHGKIVGIIGKSGVGKTTLTHLLTRLLDPDEGAVFINKRDIREYSISSLRQRIGYVEQSPIIFNGTIESNIRLGAPNVTQKQIREAAKLAGADDFIRSSVNGYDTLVGDSGSTLSGGECQRIAIARAIVRSPDIFIIDEGTSALDRSAEMVIQETMERLAGKSTVIVIAHRTSTLRSADVIFELLPGGKVIERTFDEVAA